MPQTDRSEAARLDFFITRQERFRFVQAFFFFLVPCFAGQEILNVEGQIDRFVGRLGQETQHLFVGVGGVAHGPLELSQHEAIAREVFAADQFP